MHNLGALGAMGQHWRESLKTYYAYSAWSSPSIASDPATVRNALKKINITH
jgi:hypothetical protein